MSVTGMADSRETPSICQCMAEDAEELMSNWPTWTATAGMKSLLRLQTSPEIDVPAAVALLPGSQLRGTLNDHFRNLWTAAPD